MVMIEFHILGAGGALPTATHNPAAYLVEVDGHSLVLDPGPGALVRLTTSGLLPGGVDDINQVLLSHLHPDHSLDLVALLFALHSPLPESREPLTIQGPGGLRDLLDAWGNIYGRWLEPRHRSLIIEEIPGGQTRPLPGSGSLEAFAVNHPQDRLATECLGFKFSDREGHTVVYSGDTGPSDRLELAARGVDLLVVECSTPDHLKTPGHMTPSDVGRLCATAGPRRVALTHLYPPAAAMDLVAAVGNYFAGPVVQACDGTHLSVPDETGDKA